MATTTAQPPSATNSTAAPVVECVIAVYETHEAAEDAVRKLQRGGIAMEKISIIGRDFHVREEIQGYYRPSDALKEGVSVGAWFGGLFGLLSGFGLFIFPVGGPLIVLGPLAGLIAGAITGAGIGALVSALMAMGLSKEDALKYKSRVEAGEFLLTVMGTSEELERARTILESTEQVDLQTHRGQRKAA
ncbi:MAG TPA: general stress protein [Candidatus Udaeobacter sp.]|jgi:uncharacterized membrane protein|nr:general stress protein [Candidatus Udaeobacter sp.]